MPSAVLDQAPVHNDHGDAVHKKKKKSKKNKKQRLEQAAEEEAQAVQQQPSPLPDSSDGSEIKKKKRKKHKKEKQQAEVEAEPAAAAAAAAVSEQNAAAAADGEGDKVAKKKKKSKKKRKADEEGPEADADAEPQQQHQETSKKQKRFKPDPQQRQQQEQQEGGIRKQFYVEHDKVANMKQSEVDAFRAKHTVEIDGDIDLNPVLDFSLSSLPEHLLSAVCGTFKAPSAIQAQSWPFVLSGRDVIGVAATGSGKTIAFGLPGLQHAQARGEKALKRRPFMLVLAPTRELAVQIADVCAKAGAAAKPSPMETLCVFGGVPIEAQRQALRRGVHVVVGTPGRMLDLMQQGALELAQASFVVLDEADRMLDMGFQKDVQTILGATHPGRQTLLFSATWPKEVQEIGRSFMTRPVRISIGETDVLKANRNVEQLVEVLEPHVRDARLHELLQQYHSSRKNRVLVFALYKKEAARLEAMLNRKGWHARAIHGDQPQSVRTQCLADFKSGAFPLLVATDVAARGLDIPDVTHVINYTFPLTIEDYVHRIGRTGRAGKSGVSHTLFTKHDKGHAGALGNVLREAGIEVPQALMAFGQHTKRKVHPVYGVHFREDITKSRSHVTFD